MKKNRANRGPEAFSLHYQNIFGEKWAKIAPELSKINQPILRFSPKNEDKLKKIWVKNGFEWKTLAWHPYALLWPTQIPAGEEIPGFAEHLFYPMNASSLLPVLALNPQPGELILDACAAPGGKTLFIHDLTKGKGQIIANDLSLSRSNRMKQAFTDYQADNIKVWHKKAEIIFKRYLNYFDKILVDAPCSSEKHVFNSAKHLQQWTPGRIKQLQYRQIALISGLILALKPGGTMVYATCAITPEENEMVVNKILKKKSHLVELKEIKIPTMLEHGLKEHSNFPPKMVIRTPLQENLNPIFVAKFEKYQ